MQWIYAHPVSESSNKALLSFPHGLDGLGDDKYHVFPIADLYAKSFTKETVVIPKPKEYTVLIDLTPAETDRSIINEIPNESTMSIPYDDMESYLLYAFFKGQKQHTHLVRLVVRLLQAGMAIVGGSVVGNFRGLNHTVGDIDMTLLNPDNAKTVAKVLDEYMATCKESQTPNGIITSVDTLSIGLGDSRVIEIHRAYHSDINTYIRTFGDHNSMMYYALDPIKKDLVMYGTAGAFAYNSLNTLSLVGAGMGSTRISKMMKKYNYMTIHSHIPAKMFYKDDLKSVFCISMGGINVFHFNAATDADTTSRVEDAYNNPTITELQMYLKSSEHRIAYDKNGVVRTVTPEVYLETQAGRSEYNRFVTRFHSKIKANMDDWPYMCDEYPVEVPLFFKMAVVRGHTWDIMVTINKNILPDYTPTSDDMILMHLMLPRLTHAPVCVKGRERTNAWDAERIVKIAE